MRFLKAYQASVFLVAVWGFTALLLTGEFSEILLTVCYVLTGLAYVLFRKNINTPGWLWNALTAVMFVLASLIWYRDSLLDASIYFFIYLQIAKLFMNRSPADARWIYLVTLFQVLGAAVLTTALSFAVVFVGFVAVMSLSLVLFSLCKDSMRAELQSANLLRLAASRAPLLIAAAPIEKTEFTVVGAGIGRLEPKRSTSLLRALVPVAVLCSITLLLSTGALFALIPRLSTQKLFQTYGTPPEKPAASAFDESIEFGTFERIQLDSSVAMYVRGGDKMDSSNRPDHVRLRGVALDNFNGKAWRRTTNPGAFNSMQPFSAFSLRIYPTVHIFTIIQPPGVTNYLFGETFPENLQINASIPFHYDRLSNAAWLPSMMPKDIQYNVRSNVERLEERRDPVEIFAERERAGIQERVTTRSTERQARFAERAQFRTRGSFVSPSDYIESCLQIPESIDAARLRTLATEWTSRANTTFTRAIAIEQTFRRTFGYTLEQKSKGNFIEDFLFRTKEGHCEYFATSMALLLRSLGIPARVVNGYYSTEWNEIGNAFTVRQSDAHSWVEAYLDKDYGWMTFDPTPPAGVGRPINENPFFVAINRYSDAIKVRWYRYIIDYSFTDQIGVVRQTLELHQNASTLLQWLKTQIEFGDMGELVFGSVSILGGGIVLVPIGVALLLYVLWRLYRRDVPRRRSLTAETAIKFYAEVLRQLAKRGFVRAPGQTPREFATDVSSADDELQSFLQLTEAYYESRFQGAPPSREILDDASRLISFLRRARHFTREDTT